MSMALFCAFLVVFGHIILAKAFAHYFWLEYTAALIPFLMFGLCLYAIRIASREEPDESQPDKSL